MAVVEEIKTSPSDLVMLPYREVVCDDTLREFIQVLRPDLIDRKGEVLRVQLLLDRRHKQNKGFSKPVAYFRMSESQQLTKLATDFVALATVLALNGQDNLEPSDQELEKTVDEYWKFFVKGDAKLAARTILTDLLVHRLAMEK
jgi:hypothetical protein